MSAITIEYIVASDDSCQLQFYARGHHDYEAFLSAVIAYIAHEGRDIVIPAGTAIRRTHWRKVPLRGNIVCDHVMHETVAGRGAFALTLLDEWFPLHNYVRRVRACSEGERSP